MKTVCAEGSQHHGGGGEEEEEEEEVEEDKPASRDQLLSTHLAV